MELHPALKYLSGGPELPVGGLGPLAWLPFQDQTHSDTATCFAL